MNEDNDKFLNELDEMLGNVLNLEEEEIMKVVKRLLNSVPYQRLYLLAYRLHHTQDDKPMLKFFEVRKQLKTKFANVEKFINYLISLGLAELKYNPKKRSDKKQAFGLRNPNIQKKIYKEFKNIKNNGGIL